MAGALFYNDNGTLVPLSIGYQGPQGVKGDTGAVGPMGPKGDQGDPGLGIPAGGTPGQIIGKNSLVDYDVRWVDPADIDLTSVSYLFGGNDTTIDPGPGNMAISEVSGDNKRIAFDQFDADGLARNFAILQIGDTIVVSDLNDPAETIFARYLVTKEPFDMGGWYTLDVLRTDTIGPITPPATGTELTVTATLSAGSGGGGSDGYTYVQDTAPVSDEFAPLKMGQTWYDTSTGDSYVWIDDGTSSQWVQTAPGSTGGIGPVAVYATGGYGTFATGIWSTNATYTIQSQEGGWLVDSAGTGLIVPADGWYLITLGLRTDGAPSRVILSVDGANEAGWLGELSEQRNNASRVVRRNAGDVITPYFYNRGGAIDARTDLSVLRIAGDGGGGASWEAPYCHFRLHNSQTTPGPMAFADLVAPSGDFSLVSGEVVVGVSGMYEVAITGGGLPGGAGAGAYLASDLKINGASVGLGRIWSMFTQWMGWTEHYTVRLNAGDRLSYAIGGEFWSNFTIDGRFVAQGCSLRMIGT